MTIVEHIKAKIRAHSQQKEEKREQKYGYDAYPQYGTHIDEFVKDMRGLPYADVRSNIAKLAGEFPGIPLVGLDVMAEGQIHRDLTEERITTGGLAVTLQDIRPPDLREYDKRHDITVVASRIDADWVTSARKYLSEAGAEGFAFALSFGKVGWHSLGYDLSLQHRTIQNMYNLLLPNAVLYYDFPLNTQMFDKEEWVDAIRKVAPDAHQGYGKIIIRKSSNRVVEIPKII